MTLVEVTNKQTEKEFIQLPVRLYKEEVNWIRPLDKDIREVFDPAKNKNFKTGKAIRWVLRDDSGLTIGRIAAFVNGKTAHTYDQPTGGLGFFECINDQQAANALFDAAVDWLKNEGMEAVDGPINFGDRNSWWGCLSEGMDKPNFQMPWNFTYYNDLFTGYGFKEFFKQFTYHRPMGSEVDFTPRFYERASEALANEDYEFRHVQNGEFGTAHQYFHEVYNKAWAGHSGVKPMSIEQCKKLFKSLKMVADNRLLWFAFHKGNPVAFFISIPDLNQVIQYLNGQWNPLSILKFLYLLKIKKVANKGLGVIFGVVPEHQKKGVEGGLVVSYVKKLAWKKGFPYKDIEMNWIGDFNPKMIRVVEQIGGKVLKTHITYRKLFDETKEFDKAPVME